MNSRLSALWRAFASFKTHRHDPLGHKKQLGNSTMFAAVTLHFTFRGHIADNKILRQVFVKF